MRACINNQQIRHHNKCVILELLYRQKRANKSTLARLAQISIPAVSNICLLYTSPSPRDTR